MFGELFFENVAFTWLTQDHRMFVKAMLEDNEWRSIEILTGCSQMPEHHDFCISRHTADM